MELFLPTLESISDIIKKTWHGVDKRTVIWDKVFYLDFRALQVEVVGLRKEKESAKARGGGISSSDVSMEISSSSDLNLYHEKHTNKMRDYQLVKVSQHFALFWIEKN